MHWIMFFIIKKTLIITDFTHPSAPSFRGVGRRVGGPRPIKVRVPCGIENIF